MEEALQVEILGYKWMYQTGGLERTVWLEIKTWALSGNKEF